MNRSQFMKNLMAMFLLPLVMVTACSEGTASEGPSSSAVPFSLEEDKDPESVEPEAPEQKEELECLRYGNMDISDWEGRQNTNNSNRALTGFWIEASC